MKKKTTKEKEQRYFVSYCYSLELNRKEGDVYFDDGVFYAKGGNNLIDNLRVKIRDYGHYNNVILFFHKL